MKRYSKCIALIIGLLTSLPVSYGQWTLECTVIYCSNGEPVPSSGDVGLGGGGVFFTKQDCEAYRLELLNEPSIGLCISCSQCVGSDMISSQGQSNQSTLGITSLNGLDIGESFFSPNPGQEVQDWINQIEEKVRLLGLNVTTNGFVVPSTGNKGFDKEFGQAINNYQGTAIAIEGIKVNTQQGMPSLPAFDAEKNMQIAGLEHQMQSALEERKRIERFCASPQLDCSVYQERLAKAEQNLQDAKYKLLELKLKEYSLEIGKYKQDLEKYEQDIKRCPTVTCENDMMTAIEEARHKISDLEKSINGVKNEINKKEMAWENRASQSMSNADKKEEIADERLRRIDEQLANGEITQAEAALMKADAYKDKSEVLLERTTDNLYNKANEITSEIKEEASVIKDMIIGKYTDNPDVKKTQTLVIADTYGLLSTVTPPGPSQIFGMLNQGGYDLVDRNVTYSSLVKRTASDYAKDEGVKLIDKKAFYNAPVLEKAKTAYDLGQDFNNLFENLGNLRNATIGARELNKLNKNE